MLRRFAQAESKRDLHHGCQLLCTYPGYVQRSHTNESVGKFFLVESVYVQMAPHVLIREGIVPHGSWEPQAVVRAYPVVLDYWCSP